MMPTPEQTIALLHSIADAEESLADRVGRVLGDGARDVIRASRITATECRVRAHRMACVNTLDAQVPA